MDGRAGRPYRKLGLHASDTAELFFEDARIPVDHLVGERGMGFVNAMKVLEGGRIAMAAMAVGIAEAAVDAAARYMKQRSAFGKTLAEFNGLQGMIAEMATDLEAARLLTLRAAYLKDQGQPAMHAAAAISNVDFSLCTRDERRSVFSLSVLEDRMFLYCTGGSIAAILLGAELGIMQRVLHTVHLTGHQWLVCIVVGLAIVPVSEARRLLLQRRRPAGGTTEGQADELEAAITSP